MLRQRCQCSLGALRWVSIACLHASDGVGDAGGLLYTVLTPTGWMGRIAVHSFDSNGLSKRCNHGEQARVRSHSTVRPWFPPPPLGRWLIVAGAMGTEVVNLVLALRGCSSVDAVAREAVCVLEANHVRVRLWRVTHMGHRCGVVVAGVLAFQQGPVQGPPSGGGERRSLPAYQALLR